uniref:Flavonoid 3',5'-hydroxylase n=1 Tax=Petunia hybrida TaxID=4102 RepID=B0LM39_PETHY|nr:flavonoid 3',5'-hydroxylase [Petunia x hybrida]
MMLLTELGAATSIFLIAHIIISTLISKTTGRHLPPGPRGWPVIGALPLLGAMPHVSLAKMAKKYGAIMYLKVGTCGMAVASTPDAAKAFLKTLDINFSNRPPNAGATHLAYNAQDMVFAHYGPRWKLLRKLSNLHMLGGKALENWANVRANELGHMLKSMSDMSREGQRVVVAEMLTFAMANMIGQVMLSKRVFVDKGVEVNEFKDMVVELMTIAGYFNIGDFIPCLAWMDLQGIEKRMKRLHKKFDALLTKMFDENKLPTNVRGNQIFLMLLWKMGTILKEKDSVQPTSKHFCCAIEWALAEMMKNPAILKKAQAEMDQVIGRNRRLLESDIPNLPYLRAICKETFRKHPSTPLNLPRISNEPCIVDGYYIPKNTRLSVNIWAIGRDPQVWENPLEFNPERFLSGRNSKIDPRGNDFELIPFGAGRRICAGTRMGIVMVEYILGTLVHSFDWKLPSEVIEFEYGRSFWLSFAESCPS